MKYDLSDQKAFVFDFDGVILQSEEFKIQGHIALFEKHPKIDEIAKYFRETAGINRLTRYKHVYENIIKEEYTEDVENELSNRYDEMTLGPIKNLPLTLGVEDFLKASSIPKFISSGTPHEILLEIVKHKKIDHYFKEIFGFPNKKADVTQKVLKELELKPTEVTFFGDAMADYEAATSTGVNFIARTTSPATFPPETKFVEDFTELI